MFVSNDKKKVNFMPRTARRKDLELPHHIMCRSITEIRLFKNDNDKIKYLQLIAQYCKKFQCKVLAYCLMDTHVHIQLDPKGCDITTEPYEYRSERYIYYRHLEPKQILKTIAEACNIDNPEVIKLKYCHAITEYKAISVFLMRTLCDYSYKKICKEIGNLTLSRVASLCNQGFKLLRLYLK